MLPIEPVTIYFDYLNYSLITLSTFSILSTIFISSPFLTLSLFLSYPPSLYRCLLFTPGSTNLASVLSSARAHALRANTLFQLKRRLWPSCHCDLVGGVETWLGVALTLVSTYPPDLIPWLFILIPFYLTTFESVFYIHHRMSTSSPLLAPRLCSGAPTFWPSTSPSHDSALMLLPFENQSPASKLHGSIQR